MAKDPITASDTVRALQGQPSVQQADYNQAVAEALNGHATGPADSEAPTIGSGTMTATESERKWLSDLAIEAADSALGNALMHKHPGMTAGLLSAKARTIIGECYAEGAKRSDSEIERLDYAAEKAKRIAQDMNNESASEPTPKIQESQSAPKKDPLDIYVIVRGERVKLREAKLNGTP